MAGLDAFPYTSVPASFKRLLEKVPSVGTPAKANKQWLAGLGFGGGNNEMSLKLMKQLGMLDASAAPTDFYKAVRAKDKAQVAAFTRKAYASLFEMYPDAQRQDDEALMAFARSQTDYAEGTQRLAVRTFKTLVGFGDFEAAAGSSDDEDEKAEPKTKGRTAARAGAPTSSGVGLTVNIQLQLPPSADGEVYDKLFAAMAKHLKGLVSIE